MKRILTIIMLVVVLGFSLNSIGFASEIDILLEKLVEKGILSPVEATIIKDETKHQVAAELAEHKSYAVPGWVQSVKLKGDFRLRYQYERRAADTEGRERGRIRYRLGVIANPYKNFEVGAGLASGGSGARSTNQTFGDNSSSGGDAFDTGDIRLDYAYGQYKTPIEGLDVVGGKFPRKNWLWLPTDLLWDGDINPEGASAHYQIGIMDNTELFANTGVWLMDHKDQVDRTDPFLMYFQTGLAYKDDKYDAKVAGTFYNFNGVKGSSAFDDGSGANTNTYTGSVYKYDYDSGSIGAEFGVKELFGGLPLNMDGRIALFGEFIHNPDPEDNANGWIAGVKLGHGKVKEPKSWQCKYMYANLGRDAWLDAFPDSDRYDPGRTDVKSHELVFEYALNPNVILGLDYYNSDRIKAASNRDQVVQADINFKF